MERADKIQCDAQAFARSVHLQDGLRRAFTVCHDPLPPKMQILLEKLRQNEPELQRQD